MKEVLRRDWRSIDRAFAPIEALPQPHVDAIHDATLRLLAEIGIEFMSPRARDVFRRAGADVDETSGLVQLPAELAMRTIAQAPSAFAAPSR